VSPTTNKQLKPDVSAACSDDEDAAAADDTSPRLFKSLQLEK
jgi:hypothetical protein